MPTESAGVTSAPVQVNLTAAGWAVVILVVASAFISATSLIAVGFLIPLAAALVIDVGLSWYYVTERSISIQPSRTVTHRPDGIPLRITPSGPTRPMRVTVAFGGGADEVIGMVDEPTTVHLRADQTGVVNHLRSDVACTVLGLGFAHRWQTHAIPMLHWAPAPREHRLNTPDAVDEVARLRAYVPGDRMSRVSWPITARTGQMYVRAAGEGHEEFVVVLNLGRAVTAPPGPGFDSTIADDVGEGPTDDMVELPPVGIPSPAGRSALEHTLILASTLITQLLEDGNQVRLVTAELNDQAHDDLRAVAVANPRLQAALPHGSALQVAPVDRYLVDEDDLARRLARAEPAADIAWPYGTWVDISHRGIRTLP